MPQAGQHQRLPREYKNSSGLLIFVYFLILHNSWGGGAGAESGRVASPIDRSHDLVLIN